MHGNLYRYIYIYLDSCSSVLFFTYLNNEIINTVCNWQTLLFLSILIELFDVRIHTVE